MRVGLAMGAGGVLGGAWLAGALAAICRLTGWNPAGAEVMLGTSAGSVLAALLSAGVAVDRLLPASDTLGEAGSPLAELALEESYRLPRRLPGRLPGSIGLARRALRERAPFRALCGLLPRGMVPTASIEATVRRVCPDGWPPRPGCWIVACDYETGDPMVFGRHDAPEAPLASAVAASCAIPGFFRPVPLAGRLYVDGGMRSMSNLDLLAGRRLDVVVALNPMSSRAVHRGWSPIARIAAAIRRRSARQVDAELTRLSRAGTAVLLLEPTERDLGEIGLNVMDARPAQRVAELALETTVAQLERPEMRRLLARLEARGQPRNREGA